MMAGSNLLALLSLALCVAFSSSNELAVAAPGWGDNIDWVTLDDGIKIAQEQNKPLMVIIHKTWCGACKALAPKFAEQSEIQSLGKDIVMVNTQDDEEPSDDKFSPDGKYIPRIFFLNSNGEVLTDVINERGSDKYKYYYPDPSDVVASMKQAISIASGEINQSKDEKIEL